MNEMKYTKREQRLLRKLHKADQWYKRPPLSYMIYLIPAIFAAFHLWVLRVISPTGSFHLVISISDDLRPMEIPSELFILSVIFPVGFILLFTSLVVHLRWNDKRTFKELLDKKS